MFKRLFTATVLIGMAATAPPLYAQQSCALRDTVVERLSDKYDEQLIAGGLQNSQSVIEVWASDNTGSFTILVSRADGLTCVVSSGTAFHQNEPVQVKDDQAS